VKVPQPQSFDTFTISGAGFQPQTFRVQAKAFVVPSLTAATSSTSTSVNVTVAVGSDRRHSKLDSEKSFTGVNISAPVPQQGTLAPSVQSWTVPMSMFRDFGAYGLWGGSLDLGVLSTGAVTIDVIFEGRIIDKFVL
jgi:hypothetical protein